MNHNNEISKIWTIFRGSTVVFTDSNLPENCSLCSLDSFIDHSHLSPNNGRFNVETIRRFYLDETLADFGNLTPIPPIQNSNVDNGSVQRSPEQTNSNSEASKTSNIASFSESTPTTISEKQNLSDNIAGVSAADFGRCKISKSKNRRSIRRSNKKKRRSENKSSIQENKKKSDSSSIGVQGIQVDVSNISPKSVQATVSSSVPKTVSQNLKNQNNPDALPAISKISPKPLKKKLDDSLIQKNNILKSQFIGNQTLLKEKNVSSGLCESNSEKEKFFLKPITEETKETQIDQNHVKKNFQMINQEKVTRIQDEFNNFVDDFENGFEENGKNKYVMIDFQSTLDAREERFEALEEQQRYRLLARIQQQIQNEEEKEAANIDFEEKNHDKERNSISNVNEDGNERNVVETQDGGSSFYDISISNKIILNCGDEVVCYISSMSTEIYSSVTGIAFYANLFEYRKIYQKIYEKYYNEIVESPNCFQFNVGEYFFCFMDERYVRIQILSTSFILKIVLLDEGVNMDVMAEQYIFKPIICESLHPDRIAPLAVKFRALPINIDLQQVIEKLEFYSEKRNLIKCIVQAFDEKSQSYICSYDNIKDLSNDTDGNNEEFDVSSLFYSN